jgi:hypothetical protein
MMFLFRVIIVYLDFIMTNFEQNPDYYKPVYINDMFPHLRDVPKQTEEEAAELEGIVLETTEVPYSYKIHKEKDGDRIICQYNTNTRYNMLIYGVLNQFDFESTLESRFHDTGTSRYASMILLDYVFVELLGDITNKRSVWKYRCGKSSENIGKLIIFPYNTTRVTSDVNYVVMRSSIRVYSQNIVIPKLVRAKFDWYAQELLAQIHLWPASKSHIIYFVVPYILVSSKGVHTIILIFAKFNTSIINVYVLDSNIYGYTENILTEDILSYIKDWYDGIFIGIKKSRYFFDTTPITLVPNGWQVDAVTGGHEYTAHSCGLLSKLLLSRFIRNIYIQALVLSENYLTSEVAKIDELVMMRRLIKNEFERAASERHPLLTPTYAERMLHNMVDLTGKRIYKYDYKKDRTMIPLALGVNSLTLANPGLEVYYLLHKRTARLKEPSLNEVILLDTFMTEEESKKKVTSV